MIVTAHNRPGALAERACLVADRWRWWAFVAPMLWALWNGHWLLFGALLLIVAGLMDLTLTQPDAAFALGLGLRLAMGFEAGALARLDRRLRGWRELGAVSARSEAEAELRWFGAAA